MDFSLSSSRDFYFGCCFFLLARVRPAMNAAKSAGRTRIELLMRTWGRSPSSQSL